MEDLEALATKAHADELQRMDEDTAISRTFQATNQVTLTNDSIRTPVNIKFRAEKGGDAINLPQKTCKIDGNYANVGPNSNIL